MVRTLAQDPARGRDLERWLEVGERRIAERASEDPAWLTERRRAARDRLAATGFPTRKDEAWRYTDVRPVVGLEAAAPVPADGDAARRALDDAPVVEDAAARLVVVDGAFAPDLSELPDGLRAGSLARFLGETPDELEPALGAEPPTDWTADPFTDLNTVLFTDGAILVARPGTALEGPVQVVFLSTLPRAVLRPVRLLVCSGEASELRMVETYSSLPGSTSATVAVTDLELGAGAVLDRVRVQREGPEALHLGRTRARLARDATLRSRVLALGARVSRDETAVLLDGEGASCELRGLYTADGKRHADCQTTVDHARPHGTSRQLYRGVLDDEGVGVFNGRVLVRKDAQHTDATQSNDNLLLSASARADTKPQLEILADDVQCRHGATIGELEEEAVFYLRSRGLDEAAARRMLVRGFAAAALEGLRDEPRRALVERLVREELG